MGIFGDCSDSSVFEIDFEVDCWHGDLSCPSFSVSISSTVAYSSLPSEMDGKGFDNVSVNVSIFLDNFCFLLLPEAGVWLRV